LGERVAGLSSSPLAMTVKLPVLRSNSDSLAAAGGKPRVVREILISETMRLQSRGYSEAVGVWDPVGQRIIIKRSQLASMAMYAGTLLHEIAHARSGADDITEEFEQALTVSLARWR
jgi:hypothetical protein